MSHAEDQRHLKSKIKCFNQTAKYNQRRQLPPEELKALVTLENRVKRYGLSVEDYNRMFDKQKGCCAICSKHQSELKTVLFIDHNHSTGTVRALLCSSCNTIVGLVENSDIEAVQFYINLHNKSE